MRVNRREFGGLLGGALVGNALPALHAQPAGRSFGPAGVDWSAANGADGGARSADQNTWPGGRPAAEQSPSRQTQAGLPLRVPRTNMPIDGPPSGYDAPRSDEAPVLGAPPGPGGEWPGGQPPHAKGSGTGAQQQTPLRRRSPEAARSRLAGFQLGSREATQAGGDQGWTPYSGEETSR